VYEQSEVVGFDGKPAVRGLTINVAAQPHHLAGELTLALECADVFDGGVGEREVEGASERGFAGIGLHVLEAGRKRRSGRRDVDQQDGREAHPVPTFDGAAQVDNGVAVLELLKEPAAAALPKTATDFAIEGREAHRMEF
jgi:hypothetical protein